MHFWACFAHQTKRELEENLISLPIKLVDTTGNGSAEYCLRPSLVAQCSGNVVMVEAEHLNLVSLLKFRLSNSRGFSRMTSVRNDYISQECRRKH